MSLSQEQLWTVNVADDTILPPSCPSSVPQGHQTKVLGVGWSLSICCHWVKTGIFPKPVSSSSQNHIKTVIHSHKPQSSLFICVFLDCVRKQENLIHVEIGRTYSSTPKQNWTHNFLAMRYTNTCPVCCSPLTSDKVNVLLKTKVPIPSYPILPILVYHISLLSVAVVDCPPENP